MLPSSVVEDRMLDYLHSSKYMEISPKKQDLVLGSELVSHTGLANSPSTHLRSVVSLFGCRTT